MLKLLLAFTFLFNFSYAQDVAGSKVDALRLWQKRDNKESLQEALSKFEKIHEAEPTDLDIITYLTRGNFLLAEGHLTDEDAKLKTFEKARSYGEKGLKLNPEYKKHAEKDIEKAIEQVTEKEVPVLYWTAASLGKWSKLNGIMSSIKFKDQILAMIGRVEKLKPDFFHGAVPRYWGAFYTLAPSIAGGDMKKAKKNFKKSMEMAPEYLGTKTLYAETYLVEKEDKKEFKKQLEEVLKAGPGPEDIAPENNLEKKKAQKLLEQTDDLF